MKNAVQVLEPVTMEDLSIDDPFITAEQFEGATQTLVRTLGKSFDLDVIFAGHGAKTNGKIVVLPSQDPAKMMTRKQYAVAQGYANHEALHNLCSDVPWFCSEAKKLSDKGKKLTVAIANAIEDLRIENAGQKLYPGMPSQLNATHDFTAKHLLETVVAERPEVMKDFKKVAAMATVWRGKQRMGYKSKSVDTLLSMMPKSFIERVDEWLDEIEKLETGAVRPGVFDRGKSQLTSRTILDMAQRFVDDAEQNPPPEDQEAEGEGSGEGEGDDDSQNQKPQGNQNGEQQSKQAGQNPDDGQPLDPDDQQKAVQSLLSDGEGFSWRPVSTAMDMVATKKSKSQAAQRKLNDPNGLRRYQNTMARLSGKTAVMKRKFERALLTAADTQYVNGQRTGRLNIRRHGADIVKGRENIYRRKEDGKDVNTAVTILVDASGSMSGRKMQLAAATCTALAECLDATEVKLEVLCFCQDTLNDGHSQAVQEAYRKAVSEIPDKQHSMFHRIGPLLMWEIKAFGESLKQCKVQLGNMNDMGDGGTPDGDSILTAAKRLKEQKANKHILMVLSDGTPDYSVWGGSINEYTRRCINFVTKQNVNVVGIGITTDSVKNFYKNYAVVNDISDLDKAVIDKLARMILGEDFRVDNADITGIAQNYKKSA